MKKWSDGARWRAAGTAAFLLVAGGAMGVVVDRVWLAPPRVHERPLTAGALVARLDLSASEAAHVQALLHDSLHAEIAAAVRQGPDSLWAAVRSARRRIEAALPPHARPEFGAWMEEQYEHMMDRMHGGAMDHRMVPGRESGGAGPEDHDRRP